MKTNAYMNIHFLKVSTLALILAGTAVLLTNCNEDGEPGPAPEITSFSPDSGSIGTVVTITGQNFSPSLTGNVVLFNTSVATITAASASSLTTTVPAGATTGKIIVAANGSADTSAVDFIVYASVVIPTITSFEPAYGLPGDVIVITGTNFSTTASQNAVSFNNTAEILASSATATTLTVTVPVGATTGPLEVTVNGQSVASADDFEVLHDIPQDGLVAFYPFNGTADDISGNNLDGTPTNGPAPATDRFGMADQSYSFDGEDDYITMGNPTLLQIANQVTVSGWCKARDLESGDMAIVTKLFFDPEHGGNPWKGYHIKQDFYGNGDPSLGINLYSATESATTSYVGSYVGEAPMEDSTWVFFALVVDEKIYKFYYDGVLTDSVNMGGDVNIVDDGTLGDLVISGYGGGFRYNGWIDDIAIYDRPLTTAEIVQLFEQTITKY